MSDESKSKMKIQEDLDEFEGAQSLRLCNQQFANCSGSRL